MTSYKIEDAINKAGGVSFIVGGAVRDQLLGIDNKDVDYLVRNLTYSQIKEALDPIGRVFDQEIGGKVSTLKVVIDNEEFDIAIPRISEKSTGIGHLDFEIVLDPHAPIEMDLSRRDFTINALAKCTNGGHIIDIFGGIEDLKNKLIRTVGNPIDRFSEDPLRMLRALQFAARFGFEIEEETANAIKSLAPNLLTISSERIFMEFEKAWTKGKEDTLKFKCLLTNLGIGKTLFGDQFDPIAITIEGNNEDKVIGHFVSFFLNGGNYEMMRPTNIMIEHLQSAKKAAWYSPDMWKWLKRSELAILIQVFYKLGIPFVAKNLEHAQRMPLVPKELDINGHELMEMGLKGKQIGDVQQHLLCAIFNEEIENDKIKIIEWIKNGSE